jgi:hypothetical protein
MCVCVCMYMYIYVYVCVCVCMYVRMYVCMYVCMYIYMYVCMYMCIYQPEFVAHCDTYCDLSHSEALESILHHSGIVLLGVCSMYECIRTHAFTSTLFACMHAYV